MKELTEYKHIDKSGWGEGPWQNEPDAVEWQDKATGYRCQIIRHYAMGHLCGYVAVPKGHPAHGKHYDAIDVEVHGGLTFANDYTPRRTPEDELWWLGFDCAHLDDLSPGIAAHGYRNMFGHTDVYRDFRYVTQQVEKLAKQLKEME